MDSEHDTLWHQLFGAKPRQCVYCHDNIPSLLNKAHHYAGVYYAGVYNQL